ncbi:MAG TPA: hypothetical protein VEL74_13930 [Thermoanaerobaculia bacterium]|nr:hypothetical protein [Thermoanaerobaculia bacterium]
MKQREVQDSGNVTWTCVQALSGLSGEAAAEAAEKIEIDEGTVPVVCTPSGGEQSVRIELPKDWSERMPDEELLEAIGSAKSGEV